MSAPETFPAHDFDLHAYYRGQREISERAFGPGTRLLGILAHIRKELDEVRADPTDPFEWADLIILAMDGAWRQGITADQLAWALLRKQAINRRRRWPDWRLHGQDVPIEHDRSGEGRPE